MTKYIYIVGDTNDGDYVAELKKLDPKTEILITPVIAAIKASKRSHNFDISEYGENDAEEKYGHLMGYKEFIDLIPYGEYGIHTIVSIEILEVNYKKKLL